MHRGRSFHFVSYEATAAHPGRHTLELPNTWFLVSSGNRWPAIPHVSGQPISELESELVAWLDRVVFAA